MCLVLTLIFIPFSPLKLEISLEINNPLNNWKWKGTITIRRQKINFGVTIATSTPIMSFQELMFRAFTLIVLKQSKSYFWYKKYQKVFQINKFIVFRAFTFTLCFQHSDCVQSIQIHCVQLLLTFTYLLFSLNSASHSLFYY